MLFTRTISVKIHHPENVAWDEFGSLLRQLQNIIVPLYNKAVAELYLHSFNPDSKISNSGNGGQIRAWAKDNLYLPASHNTHCSYIASGLTAKFGSNISGKKFKDIRDGNARPPYIAKNTFPIPFGNLANGLKFEEKNNDYFISVPFPAYEKKEIKDKYKPWEEFDFIDTPVKKHIKLCLSTLNRRRNGGWIKNEGIEAELQKILLKKSKVTTFEFVKRKNEWFVNLVYKFEKELKELDLNKFGGIDFGVSSPFVLAVHNSPARLTLRGNALIALNKKHYARRRDLRIQDSLRRTGHGMVNKMKIKKKLLFGEQQRIKKEMEMYAVLINRFFINNNVGNVFMENLDGVSKGEDFFHVYLRRNWPIKTLQNMIERKLAESGIKVVYQNPKYTSQICSKCGFHDKSFIFEYRQSKPKMICSQCKFEAFWDYNAALNIANPFFKNFIPSPSTKAIESQREVVQVGL